MARYITIREFSDFHRIDIEIIEEFAEYGLIEIQDLEEGPCVEEPAIEELETAVRLHRDLGINPAGIDTILHMRRRLEAMQQELDRLGFLLKAGK